jgi:hypothetical protein
LSIVAGFNLVDHLKAGEPFVSLEGPKKVLTQKFQAVDPRHKKKFLISLILVMGTALSLFIFSHQINSLIQQVVTFFYTASPDSWTGRIFASLASHSSNISEEDYVTKALRLFRRLKRVVLIASTLFSLTYFGLLVNRLTLPTFLRNAWKQRYKLTASAGNLARILRNSLNLGLLKSWFAEIFRELLNPYVILAGVTLGLATAVRAIGPWAGVIVFLYLLAKVRSRAWPTAIAYLLVTSIVTYIAWPRLWGAPIRRYLEGLGLLTNFPNYPGRVLFNGQLYNSSDLPRSYLPVLLNLQFTETFLLCAYIGLGILSWRLLRSRVRTDLFLYIGLGFAFPLFGLILLNSPLYHNFRQALFLIPAMFMLAAPALDLVFSKISPTWARVLLIAIIALPGIASSIKLYPYEYVYYNSLVGGPEGVRDRYELDYWRISLREAALELNELAPHGSTVIVTRSAGLFARYARPDLTVDKIINSTVDLNQGYDYLVQVARWQAWDMYPEVKNLVSIERDGAVLATAKAVKNAITK